MWCTRWYLPLLLLPLPTAPPYFLILFLLSLTLHAKPCFYCVVLLSTLFISSCYWQPLPLETALSSPWAANITTFAEALNATLSSNYTGSIPPVIGAVDRCWCDLSSGAFFIPFNVSNWERTSVLRFKEDLERKQHTSISSDTNATLNGTLSTSPPLPVEPDKHNSSIQYFTFDLPRMRLSSLRHLLAKVVFHEGTEPETTADPTSTTAEPEPASSNMALAFSSRELDLRPYGIDIILDYDWSRS